MNRSAAHQFCVQNGGHLVDIENKEENSIVGNIFENGTNTEGDGIWIGVNDQISEGLYHASDGSVQKYFNWKAGEPNDDNGGLSEDCVEMTFAVGFGFTWNDLLCSSKKQFICEKGRIILCLLIHYNHERFILTFFKTFHLSTTVCYVTFSGRTSRRHISCGPKLPLYFIYGSWLSEQQSG